MDNIKVAIRVRPLITREENSQAGINWKVDTHTITQVDAVGQPKKRCYNFDRVFDMAETTQDVYEEIAQPIVQSAMQGYDGTIFAYGQTSSGKTFTMHGNEETPGIIPMTVKEVLSNINQMPEREFLLRGYYIELYNESLMDLLADESKADNKKLEIREAEQLINGERKVRVSLTNQEEVVCTNAEEFLDLIKRGDAKRHVGRTNMNEHSSRSHTIFCIIIESRLRKTKRQSAESCVNLSHLYLVDLAGSEKANETKASGQRFKEACNINTSLFTLSNVISSLSRNDPHIPFRNSKLTRLLQSSLGGNSKTAIICAVTPAGIEQTHSTLQFATNAKVIKNNAIVNEILSDEALITRLKNELQEYKNKIKQYEQGELKCQINSLHGRLEQVENEKLEAEREKNELIARHEERMKYFSSVLLVANTANEDVVPKKKKKLRRETWCPGAISKVGIPITKALADANQDFHNMKPPAPFQPLVPLPSLNPLPMPSLNNSITSSASTSSLGAVDELNDTAAFQNKLPDFPSDSSSDEADSRKRKKRRRTVRFADIEEESTSTKSDEEKNDLTKQLRETVDVCEKLNAEKSSLEMKLVEKEEACNLLEYERNKYKEELDQLEAFTRRESRTIQEQEDEYRMEIQELKQKMQEMSNSMEEVKQVQQLNYEEKSLADAEFMLMDLRKKLSEMTDQNRDLKQEMEKLKVNMRKLNQEKSDFDSHMHFEKERHQKLTADLKEQLQWAYDENASLKSSVSGSVRRADDTVEATVSGDGDGESSVTTQNIAEGSIDESQMAELESIIQDKDQTIDDLEHQLETTAMLKELSEGLEGRVEELKAEVLEWNDKYVKKEEEMQVKVSYLQQQLAKQRHYSVDESFIEQNEHTNKELEQLKTALREAEERHQEELESRQRDHEKSDEELEQERKYHEAIKAQLHKLEEENQHLNQDFEHLVMAKNTTSNEPAASLQAELENQQGVQEFNTEKSQEFEQERQSHEETKRQLQKLQDENLQLSQELEQFLLAKNSTSSEPAESFQAELEGQQEIQEVNSEMCQELEQERRSHEETKRKLQQLQEEHEQLSQDLEQLVLAKNAASGEPASSLQAELQHQQGVDSRMSQEFEQEQRSHEETKRKLQELQEENQQLSADLEHLVMAKNATSSAPAASLQAELEGQQDADSEISCKLEQERQCHEETNRKLQQLQEENQQLSADLEQLVMAKNATASEPAESLQAELQSQQGQEADFEMKEELDQERRGHEETKRKLQELQEENQQLGEDPEQLVMAKNATSSVPAANLQAELGQQEAESEMSQELEQEKQSHEETKRKLQQLQVDHQQMSQELELLIMAKNDTSSEPAMSLQAELQGQQAVGLDKSAELEEERQNHEQTILKLTELEEQKDQMALELNQLKSVLQETEEKLQAELQNQQSTDVEKSKVGEELQKHLDKATEELDQERENHEATIMKLTELEGRLEDIQEKLFKTEQQLSTSQQKCDDNEWLEVEVGELKKQLAEGKETYHGVTQARDEAERKVTELSEEMQCIKQELEGMKSTLRTVEERHQAELVSRQREEVEKSRVEEDFLQQLTHEKTRHEDTKRSLAKLQEQNEQTHKEFEQLGGDVRELEQQLSQGKEMYRRVVEARDEAERKVAELSRELQSIQQELEGMKTTLRTVEEQRQTELESHHRDEVEKSQVKENFCQQLNHEKSQHEETKRSLAQLEKRFVDLQQKLFMTEQQLGTAQLKCDDNEWLEVEVQELKKQLCEGQEVCRGVEQARHEAERKAEELSGEMQIIRQELEGMKTTLRTVEERHQAELESRQREEVEKSRVEEDILQQLTCEKTQHEDTKRSLAQLEGRFVDLEQKLFRTEQQLGSSQEMCQDKEWLEAEVKELQKQLSDGKEMYRGVVQARDEAERKVTKLSEEMQQIQEELEGMKTTLNEVKEKHLAERKTEKERNNREEEFLQKCCNEADEELDQEKEEHKETKRRLKELEERNELVAREVEQLRTTLSELEEEKRALEEKHQREKERANREEEFLQKCCNEADEELDEEKEQHKETKKRLKEMEDVHQWLSGEMKKKMEELQQQPENQELERQVAMLKLEVAGLSYELNKAQEKVQEKCAIIEKEASQYMRTITELQQETRDLKKQLEEAAKSGGSTSRPAAGATGSSVDGSVSKVVLDYELYELKARNRQLTTANKKMEKENRAQGIRNAAFEDKVKELEREVYHFKKHAKVYYYKYKESHQNSERATNVVLERALHDVNETPGAERSPVRRLHHQQQAEPKWRNQRNPHMEARVAEMQAEHAAAATAAAAASRPSTTSQQQQPAEPAREMTREEKLAELNNWPSFGADEEEDKPAQCPQS